MGNGIYIDSPEYEAIIIWVDKKPERNVWYDHPNKWVGVYRNKSRRYRTIYPERVELRRSHNGINILIKVMKDRTEMSMNGVLSFTEPNFFNEMADAVAQARISLASRNT